MNALGLLSFLDTVTPERVFGWVEFGASAILILGLLIVVHEYGHFIIARLVGVRVEKFSVGFGPKIFGKTSGDTEYMLSAIPLGGYVKFYGDDPDEEVEQPEDSFLQQDVWKRLAIVAAGPVFNIALAIFIAGFAAYMGLPEGSRVIDKVFPDTPAQVAGLQSGDRIDAIAGVVMEDWKQVQETIQKSPGKEIELEIVRESGEKKLISIVPESHTAKGLDGKDVTIGRVGISPGFTIQRYSPIDAIAKGFQWTWDVTKLTIWGISKLISRDIPADQIAGPIGIMQMAGQAAQSGFVNLLLFVAVISINLGILNLLPIPVLDGGHIFFFTIEALIGKPVKLKYQEFAQQVGIFMLLSLMVLAFYNDIVRIFSNG